MKRLLTIILSGGLILGVLLAGPLSASASGPEDEPFVEGGSPGSDKADISALITALKKAGAEIEDEDIARFYDLLIEEYDLEHSSAPGASGNPFADVVPDIDTIVRKAVCLPLQEAGKNIRDKEIAAFYQEFLEDTGLTMEKGLER